MLEFGRCFAYTWQSLSRHFTVCFSSLTLKGKFSFRDVEKPCIENAGCMYCLFKVISTCSLCCDRTAEFGLFFCCVDVKHQNSGLKAVRSRPCLNLTSSCIFLTVLNFKLSFVKCSYTSNFS